MNRIHIAVSIGVVLLAFTGTLAQPAGSTIPEVGKSCPSFTLSNVKRHAKKTVTNADFQGKWAILDFWVSSCSGCVLGTPPLNNWAQKYKDKLNVMVIAKDTKATREVWDKVNTRQKLTVPYAFDSVLKKTWGIRYYPHYMILDPQGIVKAITSVIREEDLTSLLDGKEVSFPLKLNAWQLDIQEQHHVDWHKPLLIDGNGGEETDYLHRSLLVRWNAAMGSIGFRNIEQRNIYNNTLQIVGFPLWKLYQLAWQDTVSPDPRLFLGGSEPSYGRISKVPVLEVKDSSLFHYNYYKEQGIYAYSVQVPKDKKMNAHDFQMLMRRDLKNYFGFNVSLQKRMMPYFKLKTTSAKAREALLTKGGAPFMDSPQDKLELRNMPMYKLINIIWFSDQNGPACMDETGITGNIDLKLDALLADRKAVEAALLEKGLVMEKGTKEMDVIVITDP